MGQTTHRNNVIDFPKPRSVAHPAVLQESLQTILARLFTYYDDIGDFVEDCAQARDMKTGIQADRALHAWARRQLQEYDELNALRG